MPRLFNSMRKLLLPRENFRKYCVYAFGEIFLVMIGILLALQVNNWNQERLNAIEEVNILKAVSKDMARISDYCRVCGNRQNELSRAAKRLLVRIQYKDYSDSTEMIQKDLRSLINRCFVGEGLVSNIYDVLMSSDQLELLSSRELRDQLGTLDSWIGTLIPYDALQAEFVDSQLKPFLNRYTDRLSMNIDRIDFEPELNRQVFTTNYEELLSQREFSNLLTDLLIHAHSVQNMYRFIGNSIQKIDSLLLIDNPSLKTEIELRRE